MTLIEIEHRSKGSETLRIATNNAVQTTDYLTHTGKEQIKAGQVRNGPSFYGSPCRSPAKPSGSGRFALSASTVCGSLMRLVKDRGPGSREQAPVQRCRRYVLLRMTWLVDLWLILRIVRTSQGCHLLVAAPGFPPCPHRTTRLVSQCNRRLSVKTYP